MRGAGDVIGWRGRYIFNASLRAALILPPPQLTPILRVSPPTPKLSNHSLQTALRNMPFPLQPFFPTSPASSTSTSTSARARAPPPFRPLPRDSAPAPAPFRPLAVANGVPRPSAPSPHTDGTLQTIKRRLELKVEALGDSPAESSRPEKRRRLTVAPGVLPVFLIFRLSFSSYMLS